MNESTQTRGVSIVTPEHVRLQFQTAGLGSRAAAQVIDTVLLFLINLTLFIVVSIVVIGEDRENSLFAEGYAIGIVIFFFFLLNFGYYLVLEAFWSGQTLGKRWMGLRVMRDNGQPITFLSATIRNLFRVIDGLPTGYFLGAIVSFFHPQDKRIGDLVAGTLVVVEAGHQPLLFRKKKSNKQLTASEASTSFQLSDQQKQAITREDWQLLSTFQDRLPSLSKHKQLELGQQIAKRLAQKLEWENHQMVQEQPLVFLQILHRQLQEEWRLLR